MNTFAHRRRTLIVIAIVVAFVAVVIPTCRMVGCSMSMGGAMPFGQQWTPGFFGDCGGEYVVNGTPVAVVPAGVDALTTALTAVVFAALALLVPRLAHGPLLLIEATPPPPPEAPRGMRFRL